MFPDFAGVASDAKIRKMRMQLLRKLRLPTIAFFFELEVPGGLLVFLRAIGGVDPRCVAYPADRLMPPPGEGRDVVRIRPSGQLPPQISENLFELRGAIELASLRIG